MAACSRSTTAASTRSPTPCPWVSLRAGSCRRRRGRGRSTGRRPRAALDRGRERLHQRPVVERAGERVAAGGLHQGGGLAGDPRLGRPEHEEQDRGGHERRRTGHEQDVAPDRLEAGEDRRRVPPQGDDAHDRPSAINGNASRRTWSEERADPAAAAFSPRSTNEAVAWRVSSTRATSALGGASVPATGASLDEDRAVGTADLGADDAAGGAEGTRAPGGARPREPPAPPSPRSRPAGGARRRTPGRPRRRSRRSCSARRSRSACRRGRPASSP